MVHGGGSSKARRCWMGPENIRNIRNIREYQGQTVFIYPSASSWVGRGAGGVGPSPPIAPTAKEIPDFSYFLTNRIESILNVTPGLLTGSKRREVMTPRHCGSLLRSILNSCISPSPGTSKRTLFFSQ